ncbi:MAG: PilZ domain-containing protein [Dehalococcoidia bacterium]|nr:PilZ domain-containing protein [Dehalococcoidia bacterium]
MDTSSGAGSLCVIRHHASGPERIEVTLRDGSCGEGELFVRPLAPGHEHWEPGAPAFIVREEDARGEVAVAECARVSPHGVYLRLLTPWTAVNRRTFRRYGVRLSAELRGSHGGAPAVVQDLSLSGMRVVTAGREPAGPFDVCLALLGHSSCLPCEVMGSRAVPEGWELRLRYLDVSAQSLVLLTAVLDQLHALETHRPATLAA